MLTLEITLLKGWSTAWCSLEGDADLYSEVINTYGKSITCCGQRVKCVKSFRCLSVQRRGRRALTVVGFGAVNRGVVVLGWGSDWCVVFGWAVHRCEVLTVVLRYGDGPLLPQDVCKGPGKQIQNSTSVHAKAERFCLFFCFFLLLSFSLCVQLTLKPACVPHVERLLIV